MNSTVLKEIMAFLFGRKYYANIVATKGTTKQEICSYNSVQNNFAIK